MTDLKWRDSRLSNSPPFNEINNIKLGISNYANEHKPQVVSYFKQNK